MIDWGLAERVADAVAGEGAGAPLPGDLQAMGERAGAAVTAYTRLRPAQPLPPLEAVDRREWARANLADMRQTLDPIVERLLSRRGGPMRAAGGAVLAAEVGGIVGFMGRNVLGQYELRLLDPSWPPRLLLVTPNLREAARTMEAVPEELLEWVVFHEITHGVQFGGVPWLRDHLAGLLRELLSSVRIDLDPAALLRLPSAQDVRALWEGVRDGGLVTAVVGPERKATLDRLQATMALVEGHAEHVMDAAGEATLPSLPTLRAALERRRREKPPLIKLLERLLGLDLKLRQYQVGKRFCDAVVREWGIEGLNRAWEGPEQLPTLAELDDPAAWWGRLAHGRSLPGHSAGAGGT
jgi:coenzyme F420 biosynthesis associated uncharacterized protein